MGVVYTKRAAQCLIRELGGVQEALRPCYLPQEDIIQNEKIQEYQRKYQSVTNGD